MKRNLLWKHLLASIILSFALLSGIAQPTWLVQSDYFHERSAKAQPRTIRGMAISETGASVDTGLIQGSHTNLLSVGGKTGFVRTYTPPATTFSLSPAVLTGQISFDRVLVSSPGDADADGTPDDLDCAPDDPTKHATYPFYLDRDFDGYGRGLPVELCAVNENTPPPVIRLLMGIVMMRILKDIREHQKSAMI